MDELAKFLGTLFSDLLKMTVVPLAFVSIAGAIIKLGTKGTGEASRRAIPPAAALSMLCVGLGFVAMEFIGVPDIKVGELAAKEAHASTVYEFILGCIPVNPARAFADGNMLQVIVLAVCVGLAALGLEARGAVYVTLETVQKLCIRITSAVVKLAPIGAVCLLYPIAVKSFSGVLLGYLSMVAALILGSVIFELAVCGAMGTGFLRMVLKNDIVGAVSGGATNYLAPRIKCLKEAGFDAATIDYLLPLLSILMRAGSCICVGVYTVFVAHVFGVELSWIQVLVGVLLTVVALTAAPGIIGGTLIDCAIVWAVIGIPLEAVAFLAGIDYLMDIIRTVLNIQGGEIITAAVGGQNEHRH